MFYIRIDINIELLVNLFVIYIGKFNDRVLLDVDVLGFFDLEVVFWSYVDIRVEGDSYYIEDIGSFNGIYINNIFLIKGNWYRLRLGDWIFLGKGDLVLFVF